MMFTLPAILSTTMTCFASIDANTLTPAEQAAGWTLLFDGTSTDNFRGFKQERFPSKGWSVEDGTLRVQARGGGGDIVTQGQWSDFELVLEFKCAPGANSGIMYRVSEALDAPWMTGPEFQVLDDAGHKDGVTPSHSVGALYDIIPSPADKPKAPAGEWNSARIRLKDGWLAHYLNGVKVAEVRMDSQDWKDKIAASKFKGYAGFGVQPSGHIALQDHGDDVWYRNIKIRDLSRMGSERFTQLWNGKDTEGWVVFNDPRGGSDAQSPWSVQDGLLTCSGEPLGFLRTQATFTNFVARVEWRWPATPGNSSFLWRVQAPAEGDAWATWPKCVEAQLQHGRAGDFWVFQDFPITTDAARRKGKNTRATHNNERPKGEWNQLEVIADGGTIVYLINGEEVNRATGAAELAGHIALHSEGAQAQFRTVEVSVISGGASPGNNAPK